MLLTRQKTTQQYLFFIVAIIFAAVLCISPVAADEPATCEDHVGWTGTATLPTSAGTYYLTADVSLTETWTVPSGEVNLCLNGYVIRQTTPGKRVINVYSTSTLNIFDCNTESVHEFMTPEHESIEVVGGVITGGEETNGGGIYVTGGTVNLYGGNIVGNSATDSGGGLWFNGGTLNIKGGNIIANSAGRYGGGVYIYPGRVNITGGTISDNYVSYPTSGAGGGGGVYVFHGTLEIWGGNITRNSALYGGGIAGSSGSSLFMYGGNVSDNTKGGGVYLQGDEPVTFSQSGGTISRNTGSGVRVTYTSSFTLSGTGCISENTATNQNNDNNYGGGVSVEQTTSSFTMNGGRISGNTVKNPYYGGGVYNAGTFILNAGTIENNTAFNGGGVYNAKTFTMSGGYIGENTAAQGGGVYNTKTFTLTAGTIENNTATSNGGGVYTSGTVDQAGGVITKNKAGSESGGLYMSTGTLQVSGTANISKNYQTDGLEHNVYVQYERRISIGSGGLLNGAKINLTLPHSIESLELTPEYLTDYSAYFFLDEPEYYTLSYKDGYLVAEAKTYTITWKSEDSILKTESAKAGDIPSYTGEVPRKLPAPADSAYSYVFSGWTPAIGGVSEDTTYTAVFSIEPEHPSWSDSIQHPIPVPPPQPTPNPDYSWISLSGTSSTGKTAYFYYEGEGTAFGKLHQNKNSQQYSTTVNNYVWHYTVHHDVFPKAGTYTVYVSPTAGAESVSDLTSYTTQTVTVHTLPIPSQIMMLELDKERYKIGDEVTLTGVSLYGDDISHLYLYGRQAYDNALVLLDTIDVQKDTEWSKTINSRDIAEKCYGTANYFSLFETTLYVSLESSAQYDTDLRHYYLLPISIDGRDSPAFSLKDTPSYLAHGNTYEFTGTATETDTIGVYIVGTNYLAFGDTSVITDSDGNQIGTISIKDGNFTIRVTIPDDMPTGIYWIDIQHPMYDDTLSTWAQGTTVYNLSSAGEAKPLFDVSYVIGYSAQHALWDVFGDSGDDSIFSREFQIFESAADIAVVSDKESYSIGEDIALSGTADTEKLYTYILGMNMLLTQLSKDSASSNEITVENGKWEYTISGNMVKHYDPGTYTIYISTTKNANSIADLQEYAVISISLKQDFLSYTAPSTIVKGNVGTISGIASGTDEVRYYIIGDSYFKQGKTTVTDEMFTISFDSKEMSLGQYFVLLHHPGTDDIFNISIDSVYPLDVFQITDSGSIRLFSIAYGKPGNSANRLLNFLSSGNTDDLSGHFSFLITPPSVTMAPLPYEITKGSLLTVSGTVESCDNLVVAVEMLSTAFAAVPKETVGSASFVALTTRTDEEGNWEVTFDTSPLNVDEYSVSVAIDGVSSTISRKINVIEAPPTEPTEQPTERPTTTPTPSGGYSGGSSFAIPTTQPTITPTPTQTQTPAAEQTATVQGGEAAFTIEGQTVAVTIPGYEGEVTAKPLGDNFAMPAGAITGIDISLKTSFVLGAGETATVSITASLADVGGDASGAVMMHQQENGNWEELPTTYTVIGDMVTYNGETNSFSPFVLVHKENGAQLAEGQPQPTETDAADSPLSVLAVLGGLGAVAVLRRK